MKFEELEVFNIKGAMRGMRNPMNSWQKNDSTETTIGPNDMELACKLIKAGVEHRKFMRQILVSMDITAPIYWWKEMDTYTVGKTQNSTSTMHKLSSRMINQDDFETDDMQWFEVQGLKKTIDQCNLYREEFVSTKDMAYWKALIRLLPESYLQKRTVTLSYENLLKIVKERRGHKLTEWHSFIDFLKDNLPYGNELIFNWLEK